MSELTIYDLGGLLFQLWRNKWIILFITLSGMLAGMAFTVNSEPDVNFRATSSVCVTYTTYQDQMRGSSVITSYSALVVSNLVCERAAEILEDTGLTSSKIKDMLDSWDNSNSNVMFINATSNDAQLAIRVANAVAQAFIEKVSSVSGNNSLQVLDTARTAATLANRGNNQLLLSALGPLVLVCGWIVLREIRGGKIRLLSQCAEDQDELLGILPDLKS